MRQIERPKAYVRKLLSYDLSKALNRYTLKSATDQPYNIFWVPGKSVLLYGNWEPCPAKDESGNKVPDELKKIIGGLPSKAWQHSGVRELALIFTHIS